LIISFSPNTKPGVKRKQENVATKADNRKYEDKCDSCFQEHWLEKIPWLQHDERGKFFTGPADRQRINFNDNHSMIMSVKKSIFTRLSF
jgi:hypothetical protein